MSHLSRRDWILFFAVLALAIFGMVRYEESRVFYLFTALYCSYETLSPSAHQRTKECAARNKRILRRKFGRWSTFIFSIPLILLAVGFAGSFFISDTTSIFFVSFLIIYASVWAMSLGAVTFSEPDDPAE